MEILNELLKHELGEWDIEWEYEEVDKCYRGFWVSVDFTDMFGNDQTVRFRSKDNETLEIESGDDNWIEIRWYDSSVKYLWFEMFSHASNNN